MTASAAPPTRPRRFWQRRGFRPADSARGGIPGNGLRIALTGNPNCGKTTVFNHLTGARQHVGNYPGVTVEKKEGTSRRQGMLLRWIDLPGVYSLTAYSAEEQVARRVLFEERPDLVVDILDTTNLERNLYLLVQFRELGLPVLGVLNMIDMAHDRGITIDRRRLGKRLGISLVETVGHRGQGVDHLVDEVLATIGRPKPQGSLFLHYGRAIEKELGHLVAVLAEEREPLLLRFDPRWVAIKLLEQDPDLTGGIRSARVRTELNASAARIEEQLGEPAESAVTSRRYAFIARLIEETVKLPQAAAVTLTERADRLLLNRVLGLPIFLGLIYLVFQLTFTLGARPMDGIEHLFSWLGEVIGGVWPAGSSSLLRELLVEGAIPGMGSVLVFLPNIVLLFLAIGLLEDSGYMARAAFLMDRVMRKFGLQGKSFIPMLIGFGCTVPAIMATRTLESRRDRLVTMLVLPLVSCSARLPIYMLILPAFFAPAWRAPILWGLYLLGIALAGLAARLLRTTVLAGEEWPFVMELPPYRVPTVRCVLLNLWERTSGYIRKAGTVILGASILLWALSNYPKPSSFQRDYAAERRAAGLSFQTGSGSEAERRATFEAEIDRLEQSQRAEELAASCAGRIGQRLEPLLRPLGFDWRIGASLIGALAAKEVFVSTLGIVFAVGDSEEAAAPLRARLQQEYGPLTGLSIMLFMLLTTPCIGTFAVIRRESHSLKWAVSQMLGMTALAYTLTAVVYQTGRALGWG